MSPIRSRIAGGTPLNPPGRACKGRSRLCREDSQRHPRTGAPVDCRELGHGWSPPGPSAARAGCSDHHVGGCDVLRRRHGRGHRRHAAAELDGVLPGDVRGVPGACRWPTTASCRPRAVRRAAPVASDRAAAPRRRARGRSVPVQHRPTARRRRGEGRTGPHRPGTRRPAARGPARCRGTPAAPTAAAPSSGRSPGSPATPRTDRRNWISTGRYGHYGATDLASNNIYINPGVPSSEAGLGGAPRVVAHPVGAGVRRQLHRDDGGDQPGVRRLGHGRGRACRGLHGDPARRHVDELHLVLELGSGARRPRRCSAAVGSDPGGADPIGDYLCLDPLGSRKGEAWTSPR